MVADLGQRVYLFQGRWCSQCLDIWGVHQSGCPSQTKKQKKMRSFSVNSTRLPLQATQNKHPPNSIVTPVQGPYRQLIKTQRWSLDRHRERERDWQSYLELFYFCYAPQLKKTYLKEYSVYVMNNLCSPSSGVIRSCEVASHRNASLRSSAMPMWWNYYIIINKLFFLLKKEKKKRLVCVLSVVCASCPACQRGHRLNPY